MNNLTSFSTVLAKLPQHKIAQAISILLLVYIAFVAAKITWLVVPQTQPLIARDAGYAPSTKKQAQRDFNLSTLQSLNLFGEYNQDKEQVVEQVKNVPQTRLQLTLSAAVASDSAETAAAIIEYKGTQETYGIGDVIVGTRASLDQVLIDRVIIKQSGRLETLMLDGADYNQPAKAVVHQGGKKQAKVSDKGKKIKQKHVLGKVGVVDQRTNKALTKSAVQLRKDLSEDPGKITDYLRVSPARKQGGIIGYRLAPGKNPEFFKQSGLQSGDIAVQMNGYDLLQSSQAAQAMMALRTERDIVLLIKRNNEFVEILFSIE